MTWQLIEARARTAQENMDFDKQLLAELQDECLLHIYSWKNPSVTYGYFIKPHDVLNLRACQESGLDIGRRATGGGVVFHLWDLAFAALIPSTHPSFSENTLENYALINQVVLSVVKPLLPQNQVAGLIAQDMKAQEKLCEHFCMARPTIYDVVIDDKKVAGAAQRRTKKGLLHQGTISIKAPDVSLLEKTLPQGSKVLEGMKRHSYPLLAYDADPQTFHDLQEKIKNALWNQFVQQIP